MVYFTDGFDMSEVLSLSQFKGSGCHYKMTNFAKKELYKMLAFFICEHQRHG